MPVVGETITALRDALAVMPEPTEPDAAPLVFRTARGRTCLSAGIAHPVSHRFGALLRRVGLHEAGLGFRARVHVVAGIAREALDVPAVNRVTGRQSHTGIPARYVERIDGARLRRVVDHVRTWLFAATQEGGRHDDADPSGRRRREEGTAAVQQAGSRLRRCRSNAAAAVRGSRSGDLAQAIVDRLDGMEDELPIPTFAGRDRDKQRVALEVVKANPATTLDRREALDDKQREPRLRATIDSLPVVERLLVTAAEVSRIAGGKPSVKTMRNPENNACLPEPVPVDEPGSDHFDACRDVLATFSERWRDRLPDEAEANKSPETKEST